MAEKKRKYVDENEEEEQKRLKKKLLEGALRKTDRPTTIRDLGANTLKNLPANIGSIQSLMGAVNWKQAQQDVLKGLNNTVVIVGQPNTGKSTLFNTLKGQNLSPTSPQAGNTTEIKRTEFGPFTLLDTPGHLPDIMKTGMDQASVIVFLIDSSRGLMKEDEDLFRLIRVLKKPTIVAVNKVDTLRGGENADQFATEVAVFLDMPGVIPISAKTGKNVAEELVPAIIDASPEAALAIGYELPAFRRQAAQRIIRSSALLSLAAGMEPIPFIDIPILLGTQVRLVLRIAALYGEPLESTTAMKNAKELVATMVGGLGMRYAAQQAAKLVPIGGDFIAGIIAAAATWSIGQVALQYYEGGKRLNPGRVRQLFDQIYQQTRREKVVEELREEAIQSGELEEPMVLMEQTLPPRAKMLEEGTA